MTPECRTRHGRELTQSRIHGLDVDPRLSPSRRQSGNRNTTLEQLSSDDGEISQPVGLCAFYLLPHCLSVVTDVVATVSHRAWTTNRVFPLTDSSCWLSAKQGKKGRKGRRGDERRHRLKQREREMSEVEEMECFQCDRTPWTALFFFFFFF